MIEGVYNGPDGLLSAVKFDAVGLVPALAQQHDTGEVLMLAWMNRDSIAETLATSRVCYWCRVAKNDETGKSLLSMGSHCHKL